MKEKKRLVEEKKTSREDLDKQWRVDPQQYNEVDLLLWQAACTEIDTKWAATKQLTAKCLSRKPPYFAQPKRLLKPKG